MFSDFYDIQVGLMDTIDEETRGYFKHSSVQVLLCPRAARKCSWIKKQVGFTLSFPTRRPDPGKFFVVFFYLTLHKGQQFDIYLL